MTQITIKVKSHVLFIISLYKVEMSKIRVRYGLALIHGCGAFERVGFLRTVDRFIGLRTRLTELYKISWTRKLDGICSFDLLASGLGFKFDELIYLWSCDMSITRAHT